MDTISTKRDFLISFNKADRAWATWIAWVLEADGYTVWFQDWDFRGNFVEHMQRAHREATRTLAVLSDHYFGSEFTAAEWTTRLAEDPAARADLLVPVKVGPLTDIGILGPIVHADLTNCDERAALRTLRDRVRKAVDQNYRPKPEDKPDFPTLLNIAHRPQFPALAQPGNDTNIALGEHVTLPLVWHKLQRSSPHPMKWGARELIARYRYALALGAAGAILTLSLVLFASRQPEHPIRINTSGPESPIFQGTQGDVNINFGSPIPAKPAK
jgi:TIR domain